MAPQLRDPVARLVLDDHRGFEVNRDMEDVNRRLRTMASGAEGLGAAVLAAWGHGVGVEHIPLEINGEAAKVELLPPEEGCDYAFVHIPLRQYRDRKDMLADLGIQVKDPDRLRLVYHEDGLVFSLSFQKAREFGLSDADVAEVISALHQQHFLIEANIHNRQIQFKDLAVKQLIERSGGAVYVVDHSLLAAERDGKVARMRLPAGLDREATQEYLREVLRSKKECNYCSIAALNPREATIHSAHVPDLDTVRNYQFGFTFAPFGDPQDVCHFLAWDTPHIGDVVMNMDPQAYSFSDLIQLVRRINTDIGPRKPPGAPWEPIAGICNHWAGNSLYHQHYQFFRIADLPILDERRMRTDTSRRASYRNVTVDRIDWKAPAYRISSSLKGWDPDVLWVADRVAREWDLLSEGDDTGYGNGIPIQYHSQNIYVRIDDQQVTAVFIPRHRRKLSTLPSEANPHRLQKSNAGTLEMLGYFIIDDKKQWSADEKEMREDGRRARRTLTEMGPAERQTLGDAWLAELAPDESVIGEFEKNLHIGLDSTVMAPYQRRIDHLSRESTRDFGRAVWDLATIVRRDKLLGEDQREHLYLELLSLFQSQRPQPA